MSEKKLKTRLICFRVNEELLEFLDMLADLFGVDRSEMIRIIINTVRLNFAMNRPLFMMHQLFERKGVEK